MGLNITDNDEIENCANILLELCKVAESAWKKGEEAERLALVKRFCSNFRLEGATLCFDLKKPFEKILKMKRNTKNQKWCGREDLAKHSS